MTQLTRTAIQPLIQLALREDRAAHDHTSRCTLPTSLRIRARVIAKAPGVLAGGPVAVWTFQILDPSLHCSLKRRDGAPVRRGQTILTVEGSARSIFAAERTALNFLGHLSGISTLTHEFVHRVRPLRTKIFDTRKTLPGLRILEKYAVRVGGGHNHRMSLAEAILIKTNHLKALGQGAGGRGQGESLMHRAVTQAKVKYLKHFVEVEVTNFSEFKAALRARPHAVLLDNWSLKGIRRAVQLRSSTPHAPRPTPLLEVSGGVTLANVRAIVRTGVDRVSIGRLTHSAPSLDVSLEVIP